MHFQPRCGGMIKKINKLYLSFRRKRLQRAEIMWYWDFPHPSTVVRNLGHLVYFSYQFSALTTLGHMNTIQMVTNVYIECIPGNTNRNKMYAEVLIRTETMLVQYNKLILLALAKSNEA
jgi:hypothetical protein